MKPDDLNGLNQAIEIVRFQMKPDGLSMLRILTVSLFEDSDGLNMLRILTVSASEDYDGAGGKGKQKGERMRMNIIQQMHFFQSESDDETLASSPRAGAYICFNLCLQITHM